jgi:hypothetical protein
MHQGPARDTDAEPIAEERHDVREWETQTFVQDDDERRGLGADLGGRRAERVRGLQRMAALDAAATPRARAHVNAKLADDGTHDRQIFLILRDDVRAVHAARTRGTRDGQRRVVRLIDAPRHGARAVATVRGACSAARRTAAPLSMRLGERSGLAKARAPRGVELILKPLVATLQSLPLPLGTRQRIAQPRSLFLLSLDQCGLVVWRRRAHIGHTLVMSERRTLYKYEVLELRRSRAETR